MKLTPKQKAFCDYYIQTLNATESAVKAGYSKKTAPFIGSENLKKPYLRLYIDERLKQKDNDRIASQDEVLELLTQMARGEIQEETVSVYKDRSEIVKKQATPRDRNKALELLGKRYSLFTERIEANVSQDIVVEWGGDDRTED